MRVTEGDCEHVVSMCNLSVERPTVTDADGTERVLEPHMARVRNLTYSSAIMVDVVHDIYRNGKQVERRLFRETCLCVSRHARVRCVSHATHREHDGMPARSGWILHRPDARRYSWHRRSFIKTFRTYSASNNRQGSRSSAKFEAATSGS